MECSWSPLRFFTTVQGAANRAAELEVAHHQNGVAEVADVEGRIYRTHQAVLRQNQDGEHALLCQIAQEFMHLQEKEALVRHSVHIAVSGLSMTTTRALSTSTLRPHDVGELARRQFGGDQSAGSGSAPRPYASATACQSSPRALRTCLAPRRRRKIRNFRRVPPRR